MSDIPETEIESALKETQYLLGRWEFSISSTDLLWIAPTKPRLSPEELAGMLQILSKGCHGDLPRTIKLDLGGVKVVGEQWTLIEALIVDFARLIHAEVRIVGGGTSPAYSVFFSRLSEAPQGPGDIADAPSAERFYTAPHSPTERNDSSNG
ncbi:MAG: hypothetical protein HS101_02565 [Planctomycetia bacterium]|jgi:hypothetical protein|nr:hypothetical protein [Planctomycetia bacterium]MCC7314361.1 hypothetical protein [Planctomycetota bacterium]OQZ06221.1 MAG: hypothetical protein B6D36_06115 [Planctomycetes bacterium UTPLA1]